MLSAATFHSISYREAHEIRRIFERKFMSRKFIVLFFFLLICNLMTQ